MTEESASYRGNLNAAKNPEKLRDTNLNIRVNADDKKAWQDAAARAGVTASDWIIQALNEKAGNV